MPIYVYKCPTCEHEVEVLSKFIYVEDVPTCKGNLKVEEEEHDEVTMERVIAPASFNFKGKGFYQTDYKNKKK